ncbi:MAG: hypothetical protein E6I76_06420 [Chloroflexi bacterium]|nr:MAG: hypothetical protein E6I76_06420 [Chloroflexota bacterium]
MRTSPDSGGAASRTSGRWSSATRCGRGGWRTPRASRFSTTSMVRARLSGFSVIQLAHSTPTTERLRSSTWFAGSRGMWPLAKPTTR